MEIYVTQYMPFNTVEQHLCRLGEEDTFRDLKKLLFDLTGVPVEAQLLYRGVPPECSSVKELDAVIARGKLHPLTLYVPEGLDDTLVSEVLSNYDQLTLKVIGNVEKKRIYCGTLVVDKLSHAIESECAPKERTEHSFEVYTVSEFLSAAECAQLIQLSEEDPYTTLGYEVAYRSNTRVILTDVNFAKKLFERAKQYLPKRKDNVDGSSWEICGLNENIRFCKYDPGQHFNKHEDSHFVRNNNETSFYTMNVYLNEEFTDGRTRFFETMQSKKETCAITPRTGLVLFFEHFINGFVHDGERLGSGVKYIMRSDVMYRRVKNEKEEEVLSQA